VAAGSLIVTEAGGSLTDFSGNPGCIYGSEFLASNGLIHRQMLDVLQDILKEAGETLSTRRDAFPAHR
jgi:myo-inositol-1(or 4)-monophosphatase